MREFDIVLCVRSKRDPLRGVATVALATVSVNERAGESLEDNAREFGPDLVEAYRSMLSNEPQLVAALLQAMQAVRVHDLELERGR